MVNEKRLIDANEALRMMGDSKTDNPYLHTMGEAVWNVAHDCAKSCVDACPTVNAVEAVYGHWKYGTRAAVCSECGFERHLDDNFGKAVTCPNCGAIMNRRIPENAKTQ